jgi:uncharacterized protein YdaU (DUF1376 family)
LEITVKSIDVPSTQLQRMVEPGVFPSLSAVDLGIICKLIDYAWITQEHCTLPDDDQVLVAVVGTTLEQWTMRKPRVLRLLRAEKDLATGRIKLTLAFQIYQQAIEAAARRAARTRQATDVAAEKRRKARDQLGSDGSVTDESGTDSEGSAPVERSALKRSRPEHESSARSAGLVDCERSAGARAPGHDVGRGGARGLPEQKDVSDAQRALEASVKFGQLKLSKCDRSRVRGMLSDAFWDWAEEFRRSLPREVIADLVELSHVNPRLVGFVLERVNDMYRDARDNHKQLPDPIKLVIAGLGAKAPVNGRREPAWEIPPSFHKRWDKQQAEQDQLAEIQSRVNLMREQRAIPTAFSKVVP